MASLESISPSCPSRSPAASGCPRGWRPWLALGFSLWAAGALRAQELEPRAYSPSPTGFNIVVVADTYNEGDLTFDPSVPITEASARIHIGALGYMRTLGIAGRSASLGFALPYARGDFEGIYQGDLVEAYRSGLGDPRLRLAVNLIGAPAMTPQEFAARKHGGTILGASFVLGVPLGQYDPTKLVNIGLNRWAFKPELGVSREFGRWTLEVSAGAWLYTDNTDFYNGQTREQDPLGLFQWHVIYTIRPRMWVSFDANYYTGGQTTVNGVVKNDFQENSRMGVTFALPFNAKHTMKFTYSRGAITNIGADFDSFGLAWQYVWR